GAGGRGLPEGPVVGLAVVVAGEPEAHRAPDDQDRRRQPGRPRDPAPARAGGALGRDARGVQRRDVWLPEVILIDEGSPRQIDHNRAQPSGIDGGLLPPPVRAKGLLADLRPCLGWRVRYLRHSSTSPPWNLLGSPRVRWQGHGRRGRQARPGHSGLASRANPIPLNITLRPRWGPRGVSLSLQSTFVALFVAARPPRRGQRQAVTVPFH